MRILGKISTTVQCIQDGRISGNFHIKAKVVEDLNTILDTHGVFGRKLKDQLREPQQVPNEDDGLPHTPGKNSKRTKKDKKCSTSTPPSVDSTPSRNSQALYQMSGHRHLPTLRTSTFLRKCLARTRT